MIRPLAAFAAASLLAAPAYAQDAPSYTLGGTLYVQVYKDPTTIAAALAHDHVVRAVGWTGTVTWDPNDLSKCDVRISVPVGKLEFDEKGLRERLGYDTFPGDGEREDIKEAGLADNQLDAKNHPTITYRSTACAARGEAVDVTGNLTVHGVTKPRTMSMTIKADAVSFIGKGSMAFKGSDFGIEPFSKGFGALKNQDRMVMVVDVRGKPVK